MSKKILLIGPKNTLNGTPGGVTILFENLIDNIQNINDFIIVDSNAKNYSNRFMKFYTVVKSLLNLRSYTHVALNGTASDYLIFSPILLLITNLFSKTYSLRKFAGNFDEYYINSNNLKLFFLNNLLKKSSANFFETKSLVNFFIGHNKNTYWFPNVRPCQSLRAIEYNPSDNFNVLFLSQIFKEKGIEVLIEALSSFKNVKLNIAGPIIDKDLEYIKNFDRSNICYLGTIKNENVYNLMSNNHCLILPSFYPGEGYPGVIIEAFMVGLPVIVNKWNSLPELVEGHGVIIEQASVLHIQLGLKKIIREHKHYSQLSLKRGLVFGDLKNTNTYINLITAASNFYEL
jgi:glycosyltransferase involved in cell wall biosynthesis